MFISLKDNQYNNTVPWNSAWKGYNDNGELIAVSSPKYSEGSDYKKILTHFNGKSLTELAKKEHAKQNGKFLIFPFDAAKSDLDDDKKVLFELLDAESENPKFKTGNVMGFFSLRGEKKDNGEVPEIRMQITSRFDDAQDKDNFFLHYMLQKVCNIAIAPRTSSGKETFYDFLPYLFPNYLREACKQGIYRAYVRREYNDANVRGPIDVARHIRYNIPFNGKVAYHTREYTADNKITQLVRHTIEYIRSMEISILEEDARDDVGKIIQATPTYSKSNRFKVIAQNLHPITHPYYTAYEPLRILCLGILQHKKLSYGNDSENNIAGILFDGASLWEEYLAKLFAEHKLDLIHSNNRTGENGIQLLVGGRKNHYPDFYRKKNGNKESIILDAKYKRLCEDPSSKENDEDNEFDGNSQSENGPVKHKFIGKDVMQMLAYMYALDSKNAVLLSPFAVRKDLDDKLVETITEPYWKDTFGKKGKISIIAFPIKANAMNYEELCKNMKTAETAFINRIKKLLGEPVEESKMFD